MIHCQSDNTSRLPLIFFGQPVEPRAQLDKVRGWAAARWIGQHILNVIYGGPIYDVMNSVDELARVHSPPTPPSQLRNTTVVSLEGGQAIRVPERNLLPFPTPKQSLGIVIGLISHLGLEDGDRLQEVNMHPIRQLKRWADIIS